MRDETSLYDEIRIDLNTNYSKKIRRLDNLIMSVALYTGGNKYCFWEYDKVLQLMEEKRKIVRKYLFVKRFVDMLIDKDKYILSDKLNRNMTNSQLSGKYKKSSSAISHQIIRLAHKYYKIKRSYENFIGERL